MNALLRARAMSFSAGFTWVSVPENGFQLTGCLWFAWIQPGRLAVRTGKLTWLWKITLFTGKTHYSLLEIAIFNSHVSHYQRVGLPCCPLRCFFWDGKWSQQRCSDGAEDFPSETKISAGCATACPALADAFEYADAEAAVSRNATGTPPK